MTRFSPTLLPQVRRSRVLSPLIATVTLIVFIVGSFPYRNARADDATPPSGSGNASPGPSGLGMPETSSGAGAGDLASVDPSTGALRVSYPFELPRARGRIQPGLSLGFSSISGDGAAGFGWSLSVPSIERKAAGGAPDPQYNDPTTLNADAYGMDRMYFAGIPLVPVCIFGGPTPCSIKTIGPNTYDDALVAPGWYYFRAQTEQGPSTAFLWSPDRLSWRVLRQDGATLEFGKNAATGVDGTERDKLRDGRTGVFKWHLTRQYDGHGLSNPIVYIWGGLYGDELTDIFDTPKDSGQGSLAPFDGYAHHVRLTYEDQPSAHTSVVRWRATPKRRLVGVDVTSQDVRGSDNLRAMVRRYHLAYETHDLEVAGHPHHSYLSTITMEGRCANSSAAVTDLPGTVLEVSGALPATSCKAAPPTTFHYTTGLLDPGAPVTFTGLSSLNNWTYNECTVSEAQCFGCPIGLNPDQGKCHTVNGASMCACIAPLNATVPVNEFKASSLLDLNGDGLADLLIPAVNGRKGQGICFNQGGGAFSCNATATVGPDTETPGTWPAGQQLVPGPGVYPGNFSIDGQLNLLRVSPVVPAELGDSRPDPWDIYSLVGSGSTYVWTVRAHGAWDFTPVLLRTGLEETALNAADVNGDGLTDVFAYRLAPGKNGKGVTPGYGGYGIGLTQKDSYGGVSPFGHPVTPHKIPADDSDLRAQSDLPVWQDLDNQYYVRNAARIAAGQGPNTSASYELADMNGDGLVDVVAVPPNATPQAVQYWRGYGDGTFGDNISCTKLTVPIAPLVCNQNPGTQGYGNVIMTGGVPAGFNSDDTKVTFHDLNGDGLADLIIEKPTGIAVYANLDGTTFNTEGPWLTLTAAQLGGLWATPLASL